MEGFPERLHERYEPLRLLGRGGMGSVWAARDRRDGTTIAIKVLAEALAGDEDMRERLRREATVAAGVHHPNLVRILDADLDGPAPTLVMELVEGRSLRTILRAERPMAPERALGVVEAIAGALAALHARSIVHRDVKPDNVMLRPDGTPVLLDLGLVRRVDGTALTATGTILGTPAYLAPEICRGERPGPAADVFALGVTLAELISSADLFPASGPALMRCVTERAAGRAAVPLPGTTQAPLRSLVETLTAARLADRPPDGAEAVTTIGAARRRLTSGTVPSASTRTTRAARPPAAGQAPPTRAVAVRAPASPRRSLPLILTAALILTVVYIVRSRLAEVAPAPSAVSSPAPVEGRKPPTATAASVAAFERALDHLASTPSLAALDSVLRSIRDHADANSSMAALATLLSSDLHHEPTPQSMDELDRTVALLPLVVEAVAATERTVPDAVLPADLHFHASFRKFLVRTAKLLHALRKEASRILLTRAGAVRASSFATIEAMDRRLGMALLESSRRLANAEPSTNPALRYLGVLLGLRGGERSGLLVDLEALMKLTSHPPATPEHALGLVAQLTACEVLIDLNRTHEGLALAQAMVMTQGTQALSWAPDHCPPGPAAIRDAVALCVADTRDGDRPFPDELVVSWLAGLPWQHQRDYATDLFWPPRPGSPPGPPDFYLDLIIRAQSEGPPRPFPLSCQVLHLDATGVRLIFSDLDRLDQDWTASFSVDGVTVTTANVPRGSDLTTKELDLSPPRPLVPGWRRVAVAATPRNDKQELHFTLEDRWIPVIPREL